MDVLISFGIMACGLGYIYSELKRTDMRLHGREERYMPNAVDWDRYETENGTLVIYLDQPPVNYIEG